VRGAYESLRTVLGYTGVEVVEDACRRIRVTRAALGPDGLVAAEGVREQIADVLRTLAAHVERRRREGPPTSEAATRDALRATDRAFFHALVARDLPALEELLASDFLIVDVGSGGVHARDQLLDAVRDGSVVFDSIEEHPDDALTRREGDVGITVGRTSMSLASAGEPPARIDSRYTHVFRSSDGRWQLISAQGTPIRG
jgi:ketosteroid isomerase-like protein